VVRAGGDEVAAERVVVTAGLGSLSLLGNRISVPLVGARGYSVTIDGEGVPPTHALYLAEAKLGLSAYNSGVRVAGVSELGVAGPGAAAAHPPARPAREAARARAPVSLGVESRHALAPDRLGRVAADDRGRAPADRPGSGAGGTLRRRRTRHARSHSCSRHRC